MNHPHYRQEEQVTLVNNVPVAPTKEELVAAITHIAFYAGWPTAASGFDHLKNVIAEQQLQ